MIFKTLKLTNFKQYSALELDFKEGLVGIVGRNGSGKSSLFEAILLCLFGTTASEKRFYKTSWAPEKSQVSLELSFEIRNKTYLAKREFRGKAQTHHAGLYDQQGQMIASGATPVSQEVAKLIGMDKDAFTRSIFSGQKELGIISSTTGEERKKMVRRMIGLDNLDHIQKLVREDRNIAKRQIQGQEDMLLSAEDLESKQKQVKEFNKQIKAAEKQLEKCQKQLDKSNTQYQQAKTDFGALYEKQQQFIQLNAERIKFERGLEALEERVKEAKKDAADLQEKKKTLKAEQPQIKAYLKQKAQLEQLEVERRKFEEVRGLQEKDNLLSQQLQDLVERVNQLEAEIKAVGDLEKDLQDIIAQKNKSTLLLQQEEKAFDDLIAARGGLEGKIKERQQSISQIESLGKEAQCPTCLQPLINSYEQTLARLGSEIEQYQNQQLQQLNQQITQQDQQRKQCKAKVQECQDHWSRLNAQQQILKDKQQQLAQQMELGKQRKTERQQVRQAINAVGAVQFDEKGYKALQVAISEGEAFYLAHIAKEQEVSRLEEVKAQIATFKERISNGSQTIKTQKQQIKALQFSESQYEKARQAMSAKELVRDEAQQALNRQQAEASQVQNAATTLNNELEREAANRQKIEANKGNLEELETLDGIFTQFKTFILNKVRPTIAHNASLLFQQITKGRYEGIKVDDNFEFHILEDGVYYPITRFSGGEVDLANLCLRIGISKAIAELSGSDGATSFLGFDEIFGSQDEERRFEILLALDHLKEQYQQIYIISHIDSVKEHFPHILEVNKDVEGSLASWKG